MICAWPIWQGDVGGTADWRRRCGAVERRWGSTTAGSAGRCWRYGGQVVQGDCSSMVELRQRCGVVERRWGSMPGRRYGGAFLSKKKCQILGEMLKRMTNMYLNWMVFLIKKCVNMQILIHMSLILTFSENVEFATVPFLFIMWTFFFTLVTLFLAVYII